MVVVVFLGEKANVSGIDLEPLIEGPSSIVIRIRELTYQTAGSEGDKPPDRPYAFVILPRLYKSVILEEDVQQYKDAPPKWVRLADLGMLLRIR